jgi:ABC-type multidrug transport system ATPase subunit
MQNQANFLILDEPTNHLDIESREWIEDAVSDFNGTMLFISHDRFFLSQFTSKIWSMKDGEITVFDGGFVDFLQTASNPASQVTVPMPKKKKGKLSVKTKEKPNIPIPFETQIYEAEAELAALDKEITACLSDSDYIKINLLYQRKTQLENHIASLYDGWA